MAAAAPLRCFSSIATTRLLSWRNPQGNEAKWEFDTLDEVPPILPHIGKVVTTEIGCALLCVTATIECVANEVLYHACWLFVKEETSGYFNDLSNSSRFTLLWNLSNLTFFNLFYANVFTCEHCARYALDYVHGGTIAISTACVAAIACVAWTALNPKWEMSHLSQFGYAYAIPAVIIPRLLTRLFIPTQVREKDIYWSTARVEEFIPNRNLIHRIARKMVAETNEVHGWKKVICEFFEKGGVDDNFSAYIANEVHGRRVTQFVIARRLFQVLLKNEELPECYSESTRNVIELLLRKDLAAMSLAPDQEEVLKKHFSSYANSEDERYIKDRPREILNQLNGVALIEATNPLFRLVWKLDLEEYKRSRSKAH
jgi:hypothetical protein